MKSHLRLQQKIAAFGLREEQLARLTDILHFEKVQILPITLQSADTTIGEIVDQPQPQEGEPFAETLLLFADFDRKQLNAVLDRLNAAHFKVDYRAILTPTNRTWKPALLFDTLRAEKQALSEVHKRRGQPT